MQTGRESALNEMRERELKQAKKILEVNGKILNAVRDEYARLLVECKDPKAEAAYDDVLEAARWNYLQSADWFHRLERSNRVGILE